MNRKLKFLAVLVVAAAIAIIIIQVNWLKSSYKIGKDKMLLETERLLDEAMLEHKELVAKKVRGLLKRTIRPQDIETAVHYQIPGRLQVELGFRTKRRVRGSWIETTVMRTELTAIQNNPYPRLVAEIDMRDLNRLESIYSAFVGTVTFPPNSTEEKQLDSLSKCFDLPRDTEILKSILQQKLDQSNLDIHIQLTYFERIYDAYSKRPTKKSVDTNNGQIIEVTLDEFRKRTLTAHLDSLHAEMKRRNATPGPSYITKLNMDNVNAIIRDQVPVFVLKVNIPIMSVAKQMIVALTSSISLLLLLFFCLGQLFYFILKQKKLADMKDDFMANVSHELKTPVATTLAAIQGMQYFDVLNDTEKTNKYLATAAKEMQRLSVLIDAILNNAFLEKAEFELNLTPFNFREMLQGMIAAQQNHTKKKVSIQLNYIAKDSISADPSHLYNVMLNLVDNAIKYGKEETKIDIRVTARGNGVVIVVDDNGIGIPDKYQLYIFDQFFRVPQPNDHSIKGYGLGLNYVKRIIEKHGGTIILLKSDTTGSTFEIQLPQ